MAAPMKRIVAWVNRFDGLFGLFGNVKRINLFNKLFPLFDLCVYRAEWEMVYKELFSEDTTKQRHALDRISVWKSRVLNRMAMAIDCTSQLVTATLQDEDHSNGNAISSDESLRMAYAMALVRFVNLLTEKKQKRAHVQPLHIVAQQVGVPLWMVCLRHDAAHSTLPSLSLLRSSAQYALSWVKTEYWDAEYKGTSSSSDEDGEMLEDTEEAGFDHIDDSAIVRKLLASYVEQQCALFQQGDKNFEKGINNKHVKKILTELQEYISNHSDNVIGVLLEEILSNHQLNIVDIDVEALQNSTDIALPRELTAMWTPLLQLFQRLHATPLLLQSAMSQISKANSLRNRLVMGWVATIVTAICEANLRTQDNCLYTDGCTLDGVSLLRLCVDSPNKYSSQLFELLQPLVVNQLSCVQIEQLREVLLLYTSSESPPSELLRDTEMEEYTVEKLHAIEVQLNESKGSDDLNETKTANVQDDNIDKTVHTSELSKGDKNEQNSDSVWQLCTDIDNWSSHPVGCCPGYEISYTNLELPQDVGFLKHFQQATHVKGTTEIDNSANVSYENDSDSESEQETETPCPQPCVPKHHTFWSQAEMIRLKESIHIF